MQLDDATLLEAGRKKFNKEGSKHGIKFLINNGYFKEGGTAKEIAAFLHAEVRRARPHRCLRRHPRRLRRHVGAGTEGTVYKRVLRCQNKQTPTNWSLIRIARAAGPGPSAGLALAGHQRRLPEKADRRVPGGLQTEEPGGTRTQHCPPARLAGRARAAVRSCSVLRDHCPLRAIAGPERIRLAARFQGPKF